MKKIILASLLVSLNIGLQAQVELTSKSFDLESQNKHKNWFIKGAGMDSITGKAYINFVQAQCVSSSTSDASYVYTTYYGFRYKVDKLVFDDKFNYIETINKSYESTKEALLNNELIFGAKYNTYYDPFFPYQIDNSYMFTTTVSYGFTAGKDVVASYLGLKVQGCTEYPKRYEENGAANRQSKGEKWYPIYSNPIPNGGNILYSTVGVLKEEKQHYIFRKFDKDLNLVKEQTFTFDHQCLITAKSIEKAPGKFDYVFIAIPIDYKKSKIKTTEANKYEYFYIDGDSYEIKEHVKFNASNTRWVIDQVIHKDNATYLIGGCGNNNKEYSDVKGAVEEDFNNLQVAKFENNKLVYINGILNKDFQGFLKTNEGFESNSKVSLKMVSTSLTLVNNKLVYQGRQFKGGPSGYAVMGQSLGGVTYVGLQAFVINEKGALDAMLSKKGEDLGSSVSFSKDGKKMFWFAYDIGKYNKFKDGTIYANKSKFLITSLSVITYNFDSKEISTYQNLENDDWAISYTNPFLYEDENKLIMLGHKITKKAKESEVVFITIKK